MSTAHCMLWPVLAEYFQVPAGCANEIFQRCGLRGTPCQQDRDAGTRNLPHGEASTQPSKGRRMTSPRRAFTKLLVMLGSAAEFELEPPPNIPVRLDDAPRRELPCC